MNVGQNNKQVAALLALPGGPPRPALRLSDFYKGFSFLSKESFPDRRIHKIYLARLNLRLKDR